MCFAGHIAGGVTRTFSSGHELDPDPPERHHAGVVVDVQETQLIVLLAQDKEKL